MAEYAPSRTSATPRRGGGAAATGGLPALQRRSANAAIVQRAVNLNARGARSRSPARAHGQAPIQCAGAGKWLRWGGASLAALGVGAMAMGAFPLGLLGLTVGGTAALAGHMMGRKPSKMVKRARSGFAVDPQWYEKRAKTAYGDTTGLGHQGPHTLSHIGKCVAGRNAVSSNTGFDPVAISERTGVIPSPGQGRRLLREYEENSGATIPKNHKKKWDKHYKSVLARRDLGSHKERTRATVEAMELNPLTTYSLDKKASRDEIKGKGERTHTVAPDLTLMSAMDRDSPMPKFAKVDLPSKPAHNLAHMHKLFRDTGRINEGDDDLSEFELSSDEEYSSDED